MQKPTIKSIKISKCMQFTRIYTNNMAGMIAYVISQFYILVYCTCT